MQYANRPSTKEVLERLSSIESKPMAEQVVELKEILALIVPIVLDYDFDDDDDDEFGDEEGAPGFVD